MARRYKPTTLLMPLVFLNTISTASALMIVERSHPDATVTSMWKAVYLSLITMSTVGYGDMAPVTSLGKIVIVSGGIIGGTLLTTLLVAMFCEASECSDRVSDATSCATDEWNPCFAARRMRCTPFLLHHLLAWGSGFAVRTVFCP